MTITIETPPLEKQHAINLAAMERMLADPKLHEYPGKVESDQFGNIITMASATADHRDFQGEIVFLLRSLLGRKSMPELPVSTSLGVKLPDVVWCSPVRYKESLEKGILLTAPEICVEVLSPSNTPEELRIKSALYFEGGAEEVWQCDEDGRMTFFAPGKRPGAEPVVLEKSIRCPDFPARIDLD